MAVEKIVDKISLDNIAERQPTQENLKKVVNVEQPTDFLLEKKEIKKQEKVENKINNSSGAVIASNTQVQSFQKQRALEIDSILSEGLHDIFLKMGPLRQQEFKLAGEETVSKISKLLDKSKINVAKIIDLIKKWLKLIPGVNKFFLEQEAKIKADKIIRIKDNN